MWGGAPLPLPFPPSPGHYAGQSKWEMAEELGLSTNPNDVCIFLIIAPPSSWLYWVEVMNLIPPCFYSVKWVTGYQFAPELFEPGSRVVVDFRDQSDFYLDSTALYPPCSPV